MKPLSWVALVTLLALATYFWMSLNVGRARHRSGVAAPAVTGDEGLERWFRAHYNTLEWLPIFLGSMWLCAIYLNQLVAAVLGLVWIAGRILYARAYVADPATRGTGFLVQAVATALLFLGALAGIIWRLVVVGA